MTDKEIRETIKELEEVLPLGGNYYIHAYEREIKKLIDVAKCYLSAGEGLPEEKVLFYNADPDQYGDIKAISFNKAFRQCKAAVAKNYIHRSKLLTEDEIIDTLLIGHKDKKSIAIATKMSQAILNRQEEKINEST